MKKRKFLKKGIACLLIAGLPLVALTSCGFGLFDSGSSTVNTITGIETGVDADGNIVLTITFSNMDPVVVRIPMGSQGSDGTGIEAITYAPSSDGNSTIVTITYTDPDKDPDYIEIPNGSTLISAETITTEDNLSMIIFTFQVGDETESYTFTIPKGDKGDAGVGISNIDYSYTDEGVTLIISLDNGQSASILIPTGGKGDAGRGIASISAVTSGESYIITIIYSDGSGDTITLAKPADGCSWYTGQGTAGAPSNPKEGDFYFDLQSTTIYLMQNGSWVVVVSFTTDQTKHLVQFDLNDDVNSAAVMPDAEYEYAYAYDENGNIVYDDDGNPVYTIYKYEWVYPYQAYIAHNSYFQTTTNGYGPIPIPTRDGYTFKGWATSSSPTVVSGYLTETTPILTNLYLYAIWEQ